MFVFFVGIFDGEAVPRAYRTAYGKAQSAGIRRFAIMPESFENYIPVKRGFPAVGN